MLPRRTPLFAPDHKKRPPFGSLLIIETIEDYSTIILRVTLLSLAVMV